ncbi:MAG TPA: HAMP domain-containing protein, partial [Cytophagaceae bacterium]
MQIRNKIALQFTGIVALILLVFSTTIYYLSVRYKELDFDARLRERALNTAKLLLQMDEINEDLLKVLRRKYLQSLPQEFVRVYDKEHNLIFKDDTIDFTLPLEVIENIEKDDNDISYIEDNRQVTAILFKDDLGDFIVVASAIDIYGDKKIENLRLVLTIGFPISLFIIYFSGRLFARQALRPIARITKQAETITASNLDLRIDEGKGKDEISKLAIAFNQLFQRLEKSFEIQKSFVAHASHELRTPLTSITGEIEVSLMKERSESEYKQVLISILEDVKKMTKLSNALLELAQTGLINKSILIEKIRMDELFLKIEAIFKRRNSATRLTTAFENIEEEDQLVVMGNEELLLTAFINVIGNALKFSDNKPVHISLSPGNKKLLIQITDQGTGID